jgi:hypothetical protein
MNRRGRIRLTRPGRNYSVAAFRILPLTHMKADAMGQGSRIRRRGVVW